MLRYTSRLNKGFTIVELLVVIVIIGILAAITVVAFNGVQQRAAEAGTTAELKQAANTLAAFRVESTNDSYPASLAIAGITNTDSTNFQYTYNSGTNTFCLSGVSTRTGSSSFHIDNTNPKPQSGVCTGHSSGTPLVANWTQLTNSGSRSWRAVTSSADGTRLAAVPASGYIYTSNDSGATWIERTSSGNRSWTDVAMSADGTRIVGVYSTQQFAIISTDSGATWSQNTIYGSLTYPQAVTSSANGLSLAVVASYGSGDYVYTSTNGGTSWTRNTSVGASGWQSIDSSSDGTHLIISSSGGGTNGYIKYSHDSGATWSTVTSQGAQSRWGVAISNDGQIMYAGTNSPSGNLVRSTDGGATWTALTDTGDTRWRGLDTSADGSIVVGIDRNTGTVYYSTDTGATWNTYTGFTSTMRYLACSSDCTKVLLADSSGYLHRLTFE